jgi:predicted HicB family RNase H-like nuclease
MSTRQQQMATPTQLPSADMKTYPMMSFRCDDKLRRSIEREAKRRDMSISELIKQAITFHLDNLKETR